MLKGAIYKGVLLNLENRRGAAAHVWILFAFALLKIAFDSAGFTSIREIVFPLFLAGAATSWAVQMLRTANAAPEGSEQQVIARRAASMISIIMIIGVAIS